MKQLSLEDINLDIIPINVLQDVDKRISDWRSMGGKDSDAYIQSQLRYLKEEMTGCIYRHFKGELYIVTDVVVNSESLKIEVIYKDFTPSQLTWSRDLKQFFSGVNTTKYPDALQRVRFKKVGRNGEIER